MKTAKIISSIFVLFLLLNMPLAVVAGETETAETGTAAESANANDAQLQADEAAASQQYAQPQALLQESGSAASTQPEPQTTASGSEPVSYPVEFSCQTTPKEDSQKLAQDILDLLKEGFVGKEIGSGTEPNKDADKLLNPTAIVTDPATGDSAKVEMPDAEIDISEVSFLLNKSISGAFSLGLLMQDSLRVGRCDEEKGILSENCSLNEDNIYRRNSGVGLRGVAGTLKDEIAGLWQDTDEEQQGEVAEPQQGDGQAGAEQSLLKEYTPGQLENLRTWLAGEDMTSLQVVVFERLKDKKIENSILTNFFEARMQTNSPDAVISTYSMFDKIFNSWFSAEMVVGNFGPEFLYRAKKMFGIAGSKWWPWRLRDTEIYKKFYSMSFMQPSGLLGRIRAKHAKQLIYDKGFGEIFVPMVEGPGHYLIKSGSFNKYWGEKIAAKGGLLDKITSFEDQKSLMYILNDWRKYGVATEAVVERAKMEYDQVAKLFPAGSAIEEKARVEFGRKMAQVAADMDDYIGLDWPEFWMTHPSFGFRTMAVKNADTGAFYTIPEDTRNLRKIMDVFAKDGDWRNMSLARDQLAFERSALNPGNLQLYKAGPKGQKVFDAVSVADLKENVKKHGQYLDYFAELGNGEFINVSPETMKVIEDLGGTTVNLYRGGWEAARELSPLDIASSITQSRAYGRLKRLGENTQVMYNTAQNKGFGGRRFTSLLDKAFQQETSLIKSYVSPKGAVKYTLGTYFYWYGKKGFGAEDFSFYQLPDTWHDLRFTLGEEPLYNDAYIDFFANEGSDYGDLFIRLLNKLPWMLLINEVAKLYTPAQKWIEGATGQQLRDTTEDIAFFMSGPEECAGCGATVNTSDFLYFTPNFTTSEKFNAYILESPKSKDAVKKGSTIITYAHHTNLKGEVGGKSEGEPVDLIEAAEKENTCADKLKELPLGLGRLAFGGRPTTIGVVLAGMESLTYLTVGWAGMMTSVLMQTLVTSKLQDCVDYDEGYFAHYFIPSKEVLSESKDSVKLSAEKVDDAVKSFQQKYLQTFKTSDESTIGKAVKQVGEGIENFVKNSEDEDIVQATLSIMGASEGQLKGKKLFYFWCGSDCTMYTSQYALKGKTVIKDGKGNSVELDNEKGELKINGATVSTDADLVRAATGTNLPIPAEEIAQRYTTVSVPYSEDVFISIDVHGSAIVSDAQVLDCIAQGIEEQTGLPLQGNNLIEAFGKVTRVSTDTHPHIVSDGARFIASGTPRKYAELPEALIQVKGSMKTALLGATDGKPEVGNLRSIQFENGTITVKPSTNQLIVWLRHHKDGVMQQKDIKGLQTELRNTINPETGCSEAGLDLQVIADPESPRAQEKASLFNQSMVHLGPFQVFETESRRYVMYTTPAPECEQRMKVIDKETGEEIADYAMNNLKKTPTGIEFTDEDGNKHKLDFAAENGVPTISFDGAAPEALRSAQGRNGSFWYDPEKGLWYAENAQLLPLLEAFKTAGMNVARNPDGAVTATAGGNVMNIQLGEKEPSLLNLPSLPENPAALALFVISMLSVMVAVRRRISAKC